MEQKALAELGNTQVAVEEPRTVRAVEVPADLYGTLHQYLAAKPYSEVHQLIAALSQRSKPVFEAALEIPNDK